MEIYCKPLKLLVIAAFAVLAAAPASGSETPFAPFLDGAFVQGSETLSAPEADEVCTDRGVEVFDMTTADLLKLPRKGVCSEMRIALELPEETEMCKFEGLGPFTSEEFDFEEAGAMPASLDMASYNLNFRAVRTVDQNIEIFTKDIKGRFARYLERSGKFIRMMKNILREEGVPEDMAYLPLIESGYNTKAYSRMRAAGPWQFIAGTAKRYGLKVDWWVDERRDPVKSTRAAARYLRDLHDMFDSWSLAMAGYNAGENKILRAIRRTGSNDFWRLIKTRHLRWETKNYVPKFIAARVIAVDPEKYGFEDLNYESDFVYDEVTLQGPVTLDILARSAGTTVKAIKELNPELRRWSTPPVKEYKLRIPRGTREKFLASLPKTKGDRFSAEVYKVRRGDTISGISKRTGVPTSVIISDNKLNRRGFIKAGQRLIIPLGYRTN